jgi:hypothetical protein
MTLARGVFGRGWKWGVRCALHASRTRARVHFCGGSLLARCQFTCAGSGLRFFPPGWLVYRNRAPLGSRIMHHLRCFLRASRTARAAFAFIAVMAVWNLGCIGFQPLLVRMIGSAASMGMECDAEGMLVVPTTASQPDASASATGGVDRAGSVIAAAPSDHGAAGHPVSCGCQSCHAPPSALQAIAVDGASVPLARALTPATPPSISRAPLVPPPQAVL